MFPRWPPRTVQRLSEQRPGNYSSFSTPFLHQMFSYGTIISCFSGLSITISPLTDNGTACRCMYPRTGGTCRDCGTPASDTPRSHGKRQSGFWYPPKFSTAGSRSLLFPSCSLPSERFHARDFICSLRRSYHRKSCAGVQIFIRRISAVQPAHPVRRCGTAPRPPDAPHSTWGSPFPSRRSGGLHRPRSGPADRTATPSGPPHGGTSHR